MVTDIDIFFLVLFLSNSPAENNCVYYKKVLIAYVGSYYPFTPQLEFGQSSY